MKACKQSLAADSVLGNKNILYQRLTNSKYLGSAGHMVCHNYPLWIVARKQPQIARGDMSVAMFQQNFVYKNRSRQTTVSAMKRVPK